MEISDADLLEGLDNEIRERMEFHVPGKRAPKTPLRSAILRMVEAETSGEQSQEFRKIAKMFADLI